MDGQTARQTKTAAPLYDARFEHDACGVGAVVDIAGRPSAAIVAAGRQVLLNLMHRGAAGSDENTGDGAGILIQVPHAFLAAETPRLGFDLPAAGSYGVAMVFLARDRQAQAAGCQALETAARDHGLTPLGWREVPTDNRTLGRLARDSEPVVRQFFVHGHGLADEALERRLFLARKRAERLVAAAGGPLAGEFYVVSLSARTLCYKGMFLAPQLFAYYPDLGDPRLASALAVVHQRYSTNTFPSWQLAQPFRLVAHNGEINTVHGNVKRVSACERHLACPALGADVSDLRPVVVPGQSDSACFDNVAELLVRAGRSLPHAIMMMIPEAFGSSYHISTDKRAFYEYHAAIMEPWDGPAAMLFTDGRLVGGTLDRNGLRPCRYVITSDGLLVLASETGVIEFPPEQVREKGRLQPGKMFLVDTAEGRVITDNEIKSRIARQQPYRRWLDGNRIDLQGFPNPVTERPPEPAAVQRALQVFGYTREDLQLLLAPMALNGQEPLGSMGNDAPLAVLSDRPKLVFDYFKQLFAQVTNPPIDPYREGLVMSLMDFTGKRGNLLEESPAHCRQLKLPHPLLTNEDIQRLRAARLQDFKVVTLPALFDATAADPGAALAASLDRLLAAAVAAVRDGAALLILSDRDHSATQAPIPSLLAVGAVHHGLLAADLRAEAGLVVESGEPREVMHFCLLCGFGAAAVNPYLALAALHELQARGDLPPTLSREELDDHYIVALKKGILKTISKLGISTLRSYRGAQLFEAIGLHRDVIARCFAGTVSRIGGVGLAELAGEARERHRRGYAPADVPPSLALDFGGEYHFRRDGERHGWNPETITLLQHAVRQDDPQLYAQFAAAVNDQSRRLLTLRGLLEFAPADPVPLAEVEPAAEIVKRFNTGAMSHGSIGKEVHESLAVAMNRLGGQSNTGEGGEDPARYQPQPAGADLNSAIKQVASARFGVTIDYLVHARELQIKMAQGAKPGEGGQLPGQKVTAEIARLRHATPGVTLISPPPHHDIYSIEDLAQLIYDLRCANPDARISVKLVAEIGVGTVAAGVAKAHADEVLISGHDGGTGASPWTSIKHAGGPWELGLAETQQTLLLNGLRDRLRVQVDGQLRTGRDVVIGALLGAEQFGFGTAALVTQGCVLMRQCHLGNCPVGVASQDPELRRRFAGKPEHLERYLRFVAEEVRQLMAQLGCRRFADLVGRVERLQPAAAIACWKARHLDLTPLLTPPALPPAAPRGQVRAPSHALADHLDWQLLPQLAPAIERREPVRLAVAVRNVNRAVGTIVSSRLAQRYGPTGLPDGTITLECRGSAGQSFGAFLAPGVTLRLTGDANDYVGKGLSGGRIVIVTPPGSPFLAHENVIAGNTLLYGATAGELFVNGVVGERFAVRNSGAVAVAEGVGDHGCEYMTGGTVVVIGQTGRNFAAGMSGGIAYVLDEHQLFDTQCNLDLVDLETLWQEADVRALRALLARHVEWTGSARGRFILDHWPSMLGRFVKVIPVEYRRALQRQQQAETRQAEMTPATEEVYPHG